MNSLLDFIDEAGTADAAPKMEQYKIRKRSGRVLGPFDVANVLQMFARGELLGSEEASQDGVSWRPLAQIPVFSETIQKAMASALGGLDDLPVPRADLPTPKGPKDEFAVGTGDLRDAERSKEDLDRRRKAAEAGKGRKVAIAASLGLVVVLIGVAGVAVNFATPYGYFAHKLIFPEDLEGTDPIKTAVVEAPPPPPKFGDEVASSVLLERDTYIAYRQGAEQAKRLVDARKALTPFPADGKAAAAEHVLFLAHLAIVEQTPAFIPELKSALALAGGDDIAIGIGKAAVAYDARQWDEGIAIMTPLADPARSLAPDQLALVDSWLALGIRGKGDLEGAMKRVDEALQANMDSLLALSLQASLTASAGEPDIAQSYLEKLFARSPKHPRGTILRGRLLAGNSNTLEEGQALLVEMSEGDVGKQASPSQQADAFMGRAEISISARSYPEAMRFLGAAVALVPQNRDFRVRAVDFAIRLRDYTVAREHAKALLELSPDDPAGVIGLARAKIGTKDTLGAYTDLQRALKTKPDSAPLNFWFGVAAKEMGKVEEAKKQFEKAQQLDPRAADPVVENVLDAVEHGKLADALKIADGAMNQVNASERYRVRSVKAYVYARRRQFVEADKEYQQALNENPRDSDTRAQYAEALVQMKRVPDAEKQVSEAMLLDGKNPTVLLAAGEIAKARGELKQALDRFEEAMQLAPNDYDAYARASIVAAKLKDPQRAKGLAETAGQLRPSNPDVIAANAQVMAVQDPKQASSLLQQASEAAPEDPYLPFLLGLTYQSIGANLEAVDALKRATNLAPNYDDAWFALGRVQRDMGRAVDAKESFAAVSRIDNGRADAWVETADILAGQGDDDGALAAYEKALKAEPQNPVSICAMGETLILRMGQDAKKLRRGIDLLERCVRLNPKHQTAYKNLGNAFKTINKKKEAIAAYKNHLNVNPDDQENGILRDYVVDLGGKLK